MPMEVSSLLSLPDGLEVAETSVADTVLTIHLVATAKSSTCPLCARTAIRVRSYYTRLVADVPCGGRQVQLLLRVRKFRCETADCPRQVFTDWSTGVTEHKQVMLMGNIGKDLVLDPSHLNKPLFLVQLLKNYTTSSRS